MDGHCAPGVVPRRDANARALHGSRQPQRILGWMSAGEGRGFASNQPFRYGPLSAIFAGWRIEASLSKELEQEVVRQARWRGLAARIRAAKTQRSLAEV
jgi:hypothetical protein